MLALALSPIGVLAGCSSGVDSGTDDAPDAMVEGELEQEAYVKSSNSDSDDRFGNSISLSANGNVVAIGAEWEDSAARDINGDQNSNESWGSGAVYVFERNVEQKWGFAAYIKSSNAGRDDTFGHSVSLSADGMTLAVGAPLEDSSSRGVAGDQDNDDAVSSGAVYVFRRDVHGLWVQDAYIKASNADTGDSFGHSVSLSANGLVLAVGAPHEDSSARGVDGDESDNEVPDSGAVYVFRRDEANWVQEAYLKASNAGHEDSFGHAVSIAADGMTVAVGAYLEDSSTRAAGCGEDIDDVFNSGAAYVFRRDGESWVQEACLKGNVSMPGDYFGYTLSLSAPGTVLAVGAHRTDLMTAGQDENERDDMDRGAVHVFRRDQAGSWVHEAWLQANSVDPGDFFGHSVALSGSGKVLVIGAHLEDSSARGIDGDRDDNTEFASGAAYVFRRDPSGSWVETSYLKASNTDAIDYFGYLVAVSFDGVVLASGAVREDSSGRGVGADEENNSSRQSGAVYLYR